MDVGKTAYKPQPVAVQARSLRLELAATPAMDVGKTAYKPQPVAVQACSLRLELAATPQWMWAKPLISHNPLLYKRAHFVWSWLPHPNGCGQNRFKPQPVVVQARSLRGSGSQILAKSLGYAPPILGHVLGHALG